MGSVQFDAIETRLRAKFRRRCEFLNHLFDFFPAHRSRYAKEGPIECVSNRAAIFVRAHPHRRWRLGGYPWFATESAHRLTAGVHELDDGDGTRVRGKGVGTPCAGVGVGFEGGDEVRVFVRRRRKGYVEWQTEMPRIDGYVAWRGERGDVGAMVRKCPQI